MILIAVIPYAVLLGVILAYGWHVKTVCQRINDQITSASDLDAVRRTIEMSMRLAPISIVLTLLSILWMIVSGSGVLLLFLGPSLVIVGAFIKPTEARVRNLKTAPGSDFDIVLQRWVDEWRKPRLSLTDPYTILAYRVQQPADSSVWPPPPER